MTRKSSGIYACRSVSLETVFPDYIVLVWNFIRLVISSSSSSLSQYSLYFGYISLHYRKAIEYKVLHFLIHFCRHAYLTHLGTINILIKN